jgi:hypothetical protein
MNEGDVVKRAFEIAPECGSIEEVKRRLIREGFQQVNAHLSGNHLRRQIKGLINPDIKHGVPKRSRDYGQ